MRIKTIQLSWFRGAADPVSLEANCKSMVVYGTNGAGKSCFVDAVEYVLNNGRITHLAHEYSGKHQENAVPNTQKPPGRKTELKVRFKDESELKTEIKQDGSSTSSGAVAAKMGAWDYRRTILRQDEVAEFVRFTKGGKYSALLPLLGLDQMEVAAENLRKLARVVEEQSKLRETKVALKEVGARRKTTFGTDSDDRILKRIEDLHAKYCTDKAATKDARSRCKDVESALEARIERFSADQRRHVVLQDAASLDLKGHVDAVRAASVKLAGAAEPLISGKLEVLQSTGTFVDELGAEGEVNCPACGQSIPVDTFRAHVKVEREQLQAIIDIFDTRKAAISTLCDTVNSLKTSLDKTDVQSWRNELATGAVTDNFKYLDELDVETIRTSCEEEDLETIERKMLPLIDAAASASEGGLSDVQELSTDKQMVEAGRTVIAALGKAAAAGRAETLVSFINSLERGIRKQIRLRSQAVINEISADIQTMWAILHPTKAIEDVHLYLPDDADKAIEIGLKFHGNTQKSPRLTLSEGNRNSLGLCIFLAMAKREADTDRPLFLDDVVVSLDRNHRGMIAELLEEQFSGRQVIVLTHDREWYTELRQQLDDKSWIFKCLLPYETPVVGIRWSHKTTTFDDARALLKDRPDSAVNDARKIMDVELALIAERLRIRLLYLRLDKNDKRVAHDFLERLVADGKKCFQKKEGEEFLVHEEAINAFKKADRLLISWGNRGSHTFDVVHAEAAKLVDTCEEALGFFKCPSCGKDVWFSVAERSNWVQCRCGDVRWRYGKG